MQFKLHHTMLPFCGNALSYFAVILQILPYCKYTSATMDTRMKKCVLPADGGAKVWNQCTKQLINACQPGMYQPDNCSTVQESCAPCPEGSFTAGWNNCSVCFQCDICAYGIEVDCSADRNTRCKEAPVTPETLRVTTISSSPREEPSSSLPTSSEDILPPISLMTSTPCQNIHPIPTGLTSTETGGDRGIQIGVGYFIFVILAVVLLLPANVFYLRSWMRNRKARPRQLGDIVENGNANKETLLVKMEDKHNHQNAG